MTDPGKRTGSPAEGYDHTLAFQEALGVRNAAWFLGKAKRDFARYQLSVDADGRLDALLDFCSSIIALEDWSAPQGEVDAAVWRVQLRSESVAHAFIVLIALVAKHRRLGDRRFSRLRFETGRIQVWSEDPTGSSILAELSRAVPSARVSSIRTHVDDDQIEGYTVSIEVEGLMHEGRLTPLEHVIQNALSFWQARLSHDS